MVRVSEFFSECLRARRSLDTPKLREKQLILHFFLPAAEIKDINDDTKDSNSSMLYMSISSSYLLSVQVHWLSPWLIEINHGGSDVSALTLTLL